MYTVLVLAANLESSSVDLEQVETDLHTEKQHKMNSAGKLVRIKTALCDTPELQVGVHT